MSTAHDPQDVEDSLTPAESLALIDTEERRTRAVLRPDPLGMFLPWGLAYLVAFGAVWLTVALGALPVGVTVVLVAVSVIAAFTGVGVTLGRTFRGVAGPSTRVRARYGWSWVFAFAALGVANSQLADAGLPPAAVSLVWSSSALVVVGLLSMAGGLLWPGSGQYLLGVWMLVSAALSVVVGYPTNFLVLALAGGGGFVVLALVLWARGRRS